MTNSLGVGLGEIKISDDPNDILVAYGLGSCLGIGLYDPDIRLAGLLHALLPLHPNGNEFSPRYVNSGIINLLAEMLRRGARRHRLIVRMAGGANMLAAPGFNQAFNIGTRNVEAARVTLSALGLKISGEEVGGTSGRTVRFYVADGRMTIRMMGNQEREI